MDQLSCGMTPDEVAAEADEADAEEAERQRLIREEGDRYMATLDRKARYRFKNRSQLAAKEGKRRAGPAAPPWLTPEQDAQIVAIYRLAIKWEDETGIRHEVHHRFPLKAAEKGRESGRWIHYACGLHVPENLEPVPASLNNRMSNWWPTGDPLIENDERYWVDDPMPAAVSDWVVDEHGKGDGDNVVPF